MSDRQCLVDMTETKPAVFCPHKNVGNQGLKLEHF